jgi:hypothetical protein
MSPTLPVRPKSHLSRFTCLCAQSSRSSPLLLIDITACNEELLVDIMHCDGTEYYTKGIRNRRMSHVSSVKPTQLSLSNPLLPPSHAHQPFFLLVLNLIARPPCAIAPLPVLRDMVQVGLVSTP